MFKEIILFLIVLTSICINEDNMDFIRLFGSLGIAFYLMKQDFNFGYWLFTNMLFFAMLIYSATNMYNLSYFGLFNSKFIKFNTVNTRFLFVGMYVLTILNIYIYGASNSFRNQLKEKVGKFGEKGQIGIKGKSGTPSTCEGGCGDDMCYKKMLANITLIYNDWCDKHDPNSKLPEDAHIKNTFIKKKCKKMCNSEAMKTMLAAKGAETCYDYVFHAYKGGGRKPEGEDIDLESIDKMRYTCGGRDSNGRMKFKSMWRQWIELILEYKEGKNFLDSEDLTDNDFDYLLNEEVDDENTQLSNDSIVNKQKISPFDEIKKYDIWYWGSPKSARPTYIESDECRNLKKLEPKLKIFNSNIYDSLFRSSAARQSYLQKGVLNGTTCELEPTYSDKRLAGSDKIMVYRPKTFIDENNETYLPLGDVVYLGDEECHNKDVGQLRPTINNTENNLNTDRDPEIGPPNVVKLVAENSSVVKKPTDFVKMYTSTRSSGNDKDTSNYSIWRPIAPKADEDGEEYVCLGDVFSNSKDHTKPSLDKMACIKKKCVKTTPIRKRAIWNSKNKDDQSISSCDSNHNEFPENSNYKRDTNEHKFFKDNVEDTSFDSISLVRSNNNYYKSYLNKNGEDVNKTYDHVEYEIRGLEDPESCLKQPEFNPEQSEYIVPDKYEKKYGIISIYDN